MGLSSLAIAVPVWGKQTETFVLKHVLELAPQRTCIISFGGDSSPLDVPVARLEFADFINRNGFLNGLRRRGELFFHGTTSPLSTQSRQRLFQFLSEHQVDTILAEFGLTACWLASAGVARQVKLFVHFHGYDASGELRFWQSRFAYQRLASKVAGAIVPSKPIGEKLNEVGFISEQVHIVPCGVSTNDFAPPMLRKDPGHILAVGRLVEKKAPTKTIEAFSQLTMAHPGIKLIMIGDGPLRADCEKVISRLGLEGHVFLRGSCNHATIRDEMQTASIFVQHSMTAPDGDMEGLPVAILEAMASGLPVVATRHSGIPDAVIHGMTGLLVDEGDVNGMASAMSQLLGDTALRSRMGLAARERAVHSYSAEQSIQTLRRILGICL